MVDILACQTQGVTNKINHGYVSFKCPSVSVLVACTLLAQLSETGPSLLQIVTTFLLKTS